MYDVRLCSNFTDFHGTVQLSQHNLLRKLSFLHCIFLFPFCKINWLWVYGLATGLSLLFHWSRGLFFCQYHFCFDDSWSAVLPEFWGGLCLPIYSVLRISLAILGHLCFHIKFSIIGSSSEKKCPWVFWWSLQLNM